MSKEFENLLEIETKNPPNEDELQQNEFKLYHYLYNVLGSTLRMRRGSLRPEKSIFSATRQRIFWRREMGF